MPLFFASNALYSVALMPQWLRDIALVNPLSYEVNALRVILLGLPGNLPVDFGVLIFASVFRRRDRDHAASPPGPIAQAATANRCHPPGTPRSLGAVRVPDLGRHGAECRGVEE